MEYTGGLFWDVLLLSEYNDKWEDFYLSMIEVIPCNKCCNESMRFHITNPIPNFKDKNEKDKWLWEIRLKRGGDNWRKKVEDNNYTLETWKEYLDHPFTRIAGYDNSEDSKK